MGKFGWSLPPGCTMADIDRAYGDQPTMLEIFELQKEKELSAEDKRIFTILTEIDTQYELLNRLLNWAYETGYKAYLCEQEEAKYYESEYRQRVKIPRLRLFFKRQRARNPWGIWLKQLESNTGVKDEL